MNQEFPQPSSSENSEEISLHEIAYIWPEEIRNQKYKEYIGELPDSSLTEEHIASVILSPEKREAERLLVLEKNRQADQEENLQNYRR